MEAAMAITEPPLAGQWMHSFEEDHGDVVVYRPATHDFPRARGRDGLEFAPDGSFTEWAVGRGGARAGWCAGGAGGGGAAGEPVPGRWRSGDGDRVEVSTERGGDQVLEIV